MSDKKKKDAAPGLPQIVFIPASKLKLNPDNPRQIGKKEFDRLVKSLEDCPEMFNARPLLISQRTGENIIIGGNMRFLAAKKLGYKEMPCVILEGITKEKEREIAIKDNGAFGEWDWDALANGWDDLPISEWGVPLSGDFLKSTMPTGIEPGSEVAVKDERFILMFVFEKEKDLDSAREYFGIGEDAYKIPGEELCKLMKKNSK